MSLTKKQLKTVEEIQQIVRSLGHSKEDIWNIGLKGDNC